MLLPRPRRPSLQQPCPWTQPAHGSGEGLGRCSLHLGDLPVRQRQGVGGGDSSRRVARALLDEGGGQVHGAECVGDVLDGRRAGEADQPKRAERGDGEAPLVGLDLLGRADDEPLLRHPSLVFSGILLGCP
uniref:Uncharacterized protein n=1 Tax=Arundo donax TaxID=35708 RepID=A0A0A9HGT6_ARUDO